MFAISYRITIFALNNRQKIIMVNVNITGKQKINKFMRKLLELF